MIGLFLSSDNRRLLEKDLIKRYYNDLLKFDIKNYSWDECWYDYKFFTLLNLYRIIKWWTVGIPSKDWWLFLAERAFLTIEDLNCMKLLKSK